MQQPYFPGTEPPDEPNVPEIADAVDRWLAAKKKQAGAAEATKIRHETMLTLLAEHGLERYPFVDETGRKRYVVADKTPRAKTITAPTKKQRGYDDGEPPEDREVEVRRVSRASVEAEIGPLDPFASTRAGLIEEAEKRQAGGEEWEVGETRGASPDGGEPLKASIAERTKAPKAKRKPKKAN